MARRKTPVDQVVHRLARLDVVEGRMQVVEPDHALRAVDLPVFISFTPLP
jgi:hypothetical protein